MRLKYLTAMATVAAMAPALFGATPAAAGEALGTAVPAPDRSPEEEPTPHASETGTATAPAEAPDAAVPAPDHSPQEESAAHASETRASAPPDVKLEGVPDALIGGDDWSNFTLVVDNPHDEGNLWDLDMAVNTEASGLRLYGDDLRVQIQVDGAWRDARVYSPPDLGDYDLELLLEFPLPTGRTTFSLRMRAASDAPLTAFFMGPRVYDEQVQSDDEYWVWSKIIAPSEGGGEPGDPEKPGDPEEPGDPEKPGDPERPGDGEKPGDPERPGNGEKPGGGEPGSGHKPGAGGHPGKGDTSGGGKATGPTDHTKPATPPTPGNGSGNSALHPAAEHSGTTGGDTGRTAASGSLARTGSNDGTSWLIGAGGASVALGTALAAAAHRRRRATD
ncbi:hypothetical protein [Streptomyces atriruber]|uniref:hypothetical protein n=1 Tax=Streptomyces atriruber TaxID=545121 RepID=UPI0006E24C56|nr:hypothetical protein [Streptomyces atriruber]